MAGWLVGQLTEWMAKRFGSWMSGYKVVAMGMALGPLLVGNAIVSNDAAERLMTAVCEMPLLALLLQLMSTGHRHLG